MKRKILPLPELSKKIKEIAANSPHTLSEGLKYAGIPAQYISKWEKSTGRPRRAPYYDELAKLADFFEVPVETFIYADDDPYVHIPKEKYAKILTVLDQKVGKFQKLSQEIKDSGIFEYQKYID